MMKYEYSPFKAAHHWDRIERLRRGEGIFPVFFQIDLTNKCNRRCIRCITRYLEEDFNATLKFERVKILLEKSKDLGLKAVELTGGGEPTVHPDFGRICDLIRDLGLEFALVTNGMRLEEVADSLEGISWIRISVDAATPNTYKEISRVDAFGKVIRGISIVRERLPNATIGMSFIIQPENYTEIPAFAALAKSLGVDNVRFSPLYGPEHALLDPLKDEVAGLLDEAAGLEDENFTVFTLKDRLTKPWGKKRYRFCYYTLFVGTVGADGYFHVCCALKHIRRRFPIEAVERFLSLKPYDVSDCPPCWMDAKNEFIQYLVEKSPKHVNFI